MAQPDRAATVMASFALGRSRRHVPRDAVDDAEAERIEGLLSQIAVPTLVLSPATTRWAGAPTRLAGRAP